MTDQPPADRYKAETPQIPGVSSESGARRGALNSAAIRLAGGLLILLVVVFLGARWALQPKHPEPRTAEPTAQIDVPAPAPDPDAALPHITANDRTIATVSEMSEPWSSKQFFMRNRFTGENVRALLIRLPGGSAAQAGAYWAFSLNAPYGNCELEYITDISRLKSDYGFRAAKHPMVGNPCSRTLFDPLRQTTLPGNVWVRGGIVQGSDLRPPMGIEVQLEGQRILAIRME